MYIQIERTTDNARRIHITLGDGYGIETKLTEEAFLEIRKAFNSDAMLVEVNNGKVEILVQ